MMDNSSHPFWDKFDKNKESPNKIGQEFFITQNKNLILDWILSMSTTDYEDEEARNRRSLICDFIKKEMCRGFVNGE